MALLEIRQKKRGLTEAELREGLRSHLRSSGHLSSLTAQLRHRVVNDFELLSKAKPAKKSTTSSLAHRVRWSLMAEAMQCTGLKHSLSVFVPECGLGNMQNVLSRSEAASFLGIESQAGDTVLCLLDVLLDLKSKKKESAETQTMTTTETEREEKKTLSEQLRRIREEYENRRKPAQPSSMEAWTRECEERYERRLAAEVRTIREVEIARIRRDLEAKHREEVDTVAAGARAELAAREKAFRDRESWQEAKRNDQIRLAQEAAAIERRELASKLAEVTERDATQKRLIEHERQALALLQARLEQQQAEINAALHLQTTNDGRQILESLHEGGGGEVQLRIATPQQQRFATPQRSAGTPEQRARSSFMMDGGTDEATPPPPPRRLSESRSRSTRRRSRSVGRERTDSSEDVEARQLRDENEELRRLVDEERAENAILRDQAAGLQSLAGQSRAAFDALATLPSSAFSAPDILQTALQEDKTGKIQAAIDALGVRSPVEVRHDDDRMIQSIRKMLRQEGDESREAEIERRKRELDQQEREHRDRLEREKQLLADRQRIIDERERRALEDRAFNSSRELETQRKLFETMLQQQQQQPIAFPKQQLAVVAETTERALPHQQHLAPLDTSVKSESQEQQHQDQLMVPESPQAVFKAQESPRVKTRESPQAVVKARESPRAEKSQDTPKAVMSQVQPQAVSKPRESPPKAVVKPQESPQKTEQRTSPVEKERNVVVAEDRLHPPREERIMVKVEQKSPTPKVDQSAASSELEPRPRGEGESTEEGQAASLREEIRIKEYPVVAEPREAPVPAPTPSAEVEKDADILESHPTGEDLRVEMEGEEDGVEESKVVADEPVSVDDLTTAEDVQVTDNARRLAMARDKFDDHQLGLFATAFESFAKDNVLDGKGFCESLHKLSGQKPERDDLIEDDIEGFADFVAVLADLEPSLYRPPPELDASAIFDLKLKEISRRNSSPLKSQSIGLNRPSTAPANLKGDDAFYDSIDPNIFPGKPPMKHAHDASLSGDQDDDSDWSFG